MSDYLCYLMPLFFIAGLIFRVTKLIKEKSSIPNGERFLYYGMMPGFVTAIILSTIQQDVLSVILYSIGEILSFLSLIISNQNKENKNE